MQTQPFLYYWDDLDALNYFLQFQTNYQELQNEGAFLLFLKLHSAQYPHDSLEEQINITTLITKRNKFSIKEI